MEVGNGQEDLLKKTGMHGFAAGDGLRRGMQKRAFADCCGLKEKRCKGCQTQKKEISKTKAFFDRKMTSSPLAKTGVAYGITL